MTESISDREERLKEMKESVERESGVQDNSRFEKGSLEEWRYYHSAKFDMDYSEDAPTVM